jgi:nitroreductase
MDMHTLLTQARSCRRFIEAQPLMPADLEWLIDCARLSPSARNAQVLRYVMVSNAALCHQLMGCAGWAGALKGWGGPQTGERPTGFIVITAAPESGKWTGLDCGIAAQSIQLAAASKGWGCCMLGSFNEEKVANLLALNEQQRVQLVLALGVAGEQRRLAPMPADGSFNYWRDENDVHVVPKRALNDLIIKRL